MATPSPATSGQIEGDGRAMDSRGDSGCGGVPSSLVCVEISRVGPYLWSQNGRALLTVGTTAKLYSGGGEVIVHSSVAASHGSAGAGSPDRRLRATFQKKNTIENAMTNAPTVLTIFQVSQPRPGA
jgi:hypothetical protein